ncbi:MAG TPA: bifunctional (p)ppGpp synthetase/guanosine-3',5'-bis(diphosphate) 3'-pyrophosphohydrolase [Chloroflexota bacterium]|nr:bifunctional (p)ppGpp synthetase/guanosine-3',5'-bis(diphosphate) 3'-pyrophosphohydrolase [Chloroflexota bacterium]
MVLAAGPVPPPTGDDVSPAAVETASPASVSSATRTTTLFARLLRTCRQYLPESGLALIERAFARASAAHEGQERDSGEPYVHHCIETAQILADFRLEAVAIAAALLHDVLEDTAVTADDLRGEFGDEVTRLVEGVTKLSSFGFGDLAPVDGTDGRRRDRARTLAIQAENLRKLFLAMADDIRVVLIKLADRVHNMRTLQVLEPERRTRIARETLEIYAPLAARLGIWQMKWQLEDLAFRHLDPAAYRRISRALAATRAERERYIAQAVAQLSAEIARAGLRARVTGRPKHLYSIYRKMLKTGLDVTQLHDLLGVRVIIDGTEADCYTALGVVHQTWVPIPTPTGESGFRDYIAVPKENGYRSLHTTVMGPEGRALEVQIRTEEMHRDAEYGVAAHWRYKEGAARDIKFEQRIAWIRQLLDWQNEMSGSAQEFVESLKSDVLRDQVYVFTPRGELRELPAGSTPIDFAYRIHTDIGHRCIGAKVNGRLVPLDYQIRNGDVVEILTSKTPKGPSRDWLNPNLGYVKTAHAREKIRQWFKRQERAENIERGKDLLEKELSRLGLPLTKIEEVLAHFHLEKVEDLYAAVGCGEISTQAVAVRLAGEETTTEDELAPSGTVVPEAGVVHGLRVMGVGDLLTRLARCCSPVPGDPIIGFITRGNGVTVHRVDCPNIEHLTDRERLVNVEWGRLRQQVVPASIRLEAWDRDGLLRDVAALVAEDRVNMTSVSAVTHPDHTATIRATLEIDDIRTLSRILSRLERIKGVRSVTRDVS